MDDIETTRHQLDDQLRSAVASDPLHALAAIGGVRRDLAARQGEGVRAAVQQHTWGEIGAALGLTKQAAHKRLGKEWAATMKGELATAVQAYKTAARSGPAEEATAARVRMDALIAEFKGASRRRK
jgi:hypothetical protein